MDINEMKQLLKATGLKMTAPRLIILELFSSNDKALTIADLLRGTNKNFDRVSLYRILKIFEDEGIIHRIVGASSSTSYALSKIPKVKKEQNFQQHLHFSCIKCNCIYCLDDHLVPSVTLPAIYHIHSLSMTVTGICHLCRVN